ncbi:MAG: 1-(5-phosphoribosyl)-5-[(5-phosphoribosylamino)methylideneamino]imidazole-4-carboxamide isomerase [Elusimicrobia bacterium]|nr:1-(5-phosphoribosyl)-5-[(5-phosphoribosylamino)methylideneamino]imidazole-4-carboxamide isomerase [Candidatus Obscuribacterium magneticum]
MSMMIIPAVDIRNGKCVRLRHGKIEEETIYSNDPVDMAKQWVSVGAGRLHVVDLDGAFTGQPKNLDQILKIKQETGAFVQMGGGMRNIATIQRVLQAGIDRVILGTMVLEQAGLAQDAFNKYKDRIMVAMDVDQGLVAIRGWKESSGFPLKDALSIVEKLGGLEIIFTDISRDGTLQGINVGTVEDVMSKTKMKVFYSGGVSSLDDIKKLKEIGSPGCIVGKAIYDKKLDLKVAIQLAS